MIFAYARVSTQDQNAARQVDAFLENGVLLENIFIDKASGKNFERIEYKNMKRTLRTGDICVIKSIDRLGRSYEAIKKEFKAITDKGVYIHVLDMPILNTDQELGTGLQTKFIVDIVLSILGYVAEQERAFNKQRQAEGIESAKKRNIKFGRPRADIKKLKIAFDLVQTGRTITEACDIAVIKRRTYYNYLKSLENSN